MHYISLLRKGLIFMACFCLANNSHAQKLSQTIRGHIVDADSKKELPDAHIAILNTSTPKFTLSDEEGYFRIDDIPFGRYQLKISLLGYEDKLLSDILVVAGKETILEVKVQESYKSLKDVLIHAQSDKSRVANDMALLSARTFSVEETKRYAGAINDPARMVASYAGVNSDGSGNNDIIVRGNNSRNIQWKLEGIEIPNPNHFASEGLTGGPINALNSQMLANSAFYTGAFSPEYGNALAGIFDMHLRKGNNEKREYSFSAGILGTDLTIEGPFKKGKKSSYLANYRYSTLGILDQLGIVNFNGVPKYQDGSFKIVIPSTKLGEMSLFGLGGSSTITQKIYEESDSKRLQEQWQQSSHLAVVGLHQYLSINDHIYLSNSISFSNNGSKTLGQLPIDTGHLKDNFDANLQNTAFRLASTLNVKINAQHKLQVGVLGTQYDFDFKSHSLNQATQVYQTRQANKGEAQLIQGFVSWRWRIKEQLTMVSGLHTQKMSLNKKASLEPRLAFRYDFKSGQAFSAGMGMHSKMDALPNYFALIDNQMPNKSLSFTKATHWVISYENKLNKHLFLKLEAYYQHLYNVPIDTDLKSTYSLLNQDEAFTAHALSNQGKGRNLGLEMTLERYFDQNYYFMITGALFDSKYLSSDGIWRNTRFNGNFTSNILFGREFKLRSGTQKTRTLSINTRSSLLGGRRQLPIDLMASRAAGKAVYIESKAFETKNDNIFSLNLSIIYRVNRKRTSHELKLDIQNLTGNAAEVDHYYNNISQNIETLKQLSTLPILSYTYNF